jgi:hypothetical protein
MRAVQPVLAKRWAVGFFDRLGRQSIVPARQSAAVDPAAALLARYDPKASIGPAEAAELGAKLRAIYESDHMRFAGVLPVLRRLEGEAGSVRGRHYTEWVPVLDQLRSQKADDQAVPLLLECVAAAERAASVNGMEPAPGYTERLAIIYRRRREYPREIDLIESWFSRCPPPYGSEKLAKRLQDAILLEANTKAAG